MVIQGSSSSSSGGRREVIPQEYVLDIDRHNSQLIPCTLSASYLPPISPRHNLNGLCLFSKLKAWPSEYITLHYIILCAQCRYSCSIAFPFARDPNRWSSPGHEGVSSQTNSLTTHYGIGSLRQQPVSWDTWSIILLIKAMLRQVDGGKWERGWWFFICHVHFVVLQIESIKTATMVS